MTLVSDKSNGIVTEIYLDLDMLSISSSKIRIFALDSQTIGVSNNPPELWIENCLWQGETDIISDEQEHTILLPMSIVSFYQPRQVELAGSIERDNFLLIVHR